MAHKKGGGTTRNGRDSKAKRLGVKTFAGQEVLAVMVLIVLIGMVVDLVVFGVLDRRIRAKRGLLASR